MGTAPNVRNQRVKLQLSICAEVRWLSFANFLCLLKNSVNQASKFMEHLLCVDTDLDLELQHGKMPLVPLKNVVGEQAANSCWSCRSHVRLPSPRKPSLIPH